MEVDEILISHWIDGRPVSAAVAAHSRRTACRERGNTLVPRYYNGVLLRRTTISCVATAFLLCVHFRAAPLRPPSRFLSKSNGAQLCRLRPPSRPPSTTTMPISRCARISWLRCSLTDGKTAWSVECPMTSAPAAGDGLVFAGSDDLIEARAAADGRPQWRRPIKGTRRITALGYGMASRVDRDRPAAGVACVRRRNPLAARSGCASPGSASPGGRSRVSPAEGRTGSGALAPNRRRNLGRTS